MESPQTLQQAIQHFTDEQVCIDAVAAMRWPEGVECPHCDAKQPYYLKTQKRWKCRMCRKQFSVKVGTIFEDSPVSLCKWLPALWMIVSDKNGISSWELHRALGVTQKTAWFMLHRLRLAMRHNSIRKLDGGPVEVDETYIGGQKRFMHASKQKRYYAEGGPTGKTIVMGFLDRELRQVRARVVPNAKRETLQNEILNLVSRGAKIYTDDASAYDQWRKDFVHEVVNKTESYVRGQVHVQGIENFWSLLKRMLRGTYVAVEPFHLDRYLDEQIFRYENRATKDNPLNDADRFAAALARVAGRRVTYKELTGKLGTTPF
ncbi:MAG: IS1595 family transposase [Candidatus Korobacteraceae bacterium]